MSVRVAGHHSQPFSIQRGTRQGCPLSPLLFALAIEPLAAWVRSDPVLRGFDWSQSCSDRIALYADDVLFFMTNPWNSGPRILNILRVFGDTSGLHANPAKSILFPVFGHQGRNTWASQLSRATEGFKYLGIHISPCPKISWARNISPLLASLPNETTVWSSLPLSLYGPSAIFKMVSLPRILYCLQNYPYPIPPTWIAQVATIQNKLMWNGGAVRVALRTCTQSTYCGGIAAADVYAYYVASHVMIINEWWYCSPTDSAYSAEHAAMDQVPLLHLLYSTVRLDHLPPAGRAVIQPWRAKT